jgi:uncharacterized protein YraI
MFRTFTAAALIALTAAPAFAGAAWTTNGANLRSGPGKAYDIVGYLPECAKLKTYEYEGSWVKVSWNGAYGWVTARYISESNGHCGGGYNGGSKGGYDSGY